MGNYCFDLKMGIMASISSALCVSQKEMIASTSFLVALSAAAESLLFVSVALRERIKLAIASFCIVRETESASVEGASSSIFLAGVDGLGCTSDVFGVPSLLGFCSSGISAPCFGGVTNFFVVVPSWLVAGLAMICFCFLGCTGELVSTSVWFDLRFCVVGGNTSFFCDKPSQC